MMTWQQYANRRKVDVASWIRANGIVNYTDFVDVCAGRGVLPPPESDVSSHFGTAAHEGKAELEKSSGIKQEPVIVSDPVPDSVIKPPAEPVEVLPEVEEPENVIETLPEDEEKHGQQDTEGEDLSDMGVYDVDDEGFLVVKPQPSTKRVFSGGKLSSANDLDSK